MLKLINVYVLLFHYHFTLLTLYRGYDLVQLNIIRISTRRDMT